MAHVVAVLGLSQVLVETTDGEMTRYVYGHDLLAEKSTAWVWHLDDGLGSVRQLADGSGNVTLAQGYTPFGVPLWSEGSGETGYGFTGERWEAYTGLLFLRARYYEPGTGRFVSRDLWEGGPQRPLTLNAYLYVLDNPVNAIDPSGLYHEEVHYDLTWRWAYETAKRYGFEESMVRSIAALIAKGDVWVDDSSNLNSAYWACNDCHFCPWGPTSRHVTEAIESGNPFEFGASLHQLQDWSTHWNEGYEDSHASDTVRAKMRTWIQIQDFYQGWHVQSGIPPIILSPFPPHPKEKVKQDLQRRNPWLTILVRLSDDDLIDLYLRKELDMDPEWNQRVRERSYFGLDPDKYIEGSQRDTFMEFSTRLSIVLFMERLVADTCAINWEQPDDTDIKRLLTE